MWHPAWTLELLLRCAYYSCPKLASTLMLKTIVGGLGCEQGTSSGSLVPQRSLLLQGKEGGEKKVNFLAPVLSVHEMKSGAQTAYPFHLACQCLKIRSFCPHDSERITYILWLSVDRFARSYGQVELTKEIYNGKGTHFPCKYYFKGSQGQIRPSFGVQGKTPN